MLPSIGTGRRPESVHDGQGGWRETDEATWPIVADGVACKYDPGSNGEQVVAQQERGELTGRLFVLLDVDIARGDVWTINGFAETFGEIYDDRRLRVEAVTQPGGRSISGLAGGQKVATVLELQPDNA